MDKKAAQKAGKRVAKAYLKEDRDPTQALAKLAEQKDLKAKQIELVANEANSEIIVDLQKEAVQDDSEVEPHFTYPTVKTADVIRIINTEGRASPKPPEKEIDRSIDDILPKPNDPVPDKPSYDAESIAESDCIEFEPPSRDAAAKLVSKLKQKCQQKERDLQALERKLEGLERKIKKRAKQEIGHGTPLEVLEALPDPSGAIDKVASKYEDQASRLGGEDFNVNRDHSLFKMAEQAEVLKEQIERARESYEFQSSRLKNAQHAYRNL